MCSPSEAENEHIHTLPNGPQPKDPRIETKREAEFGGKNLLFKL